LPNIPNTNLPNQTLFSKGDGQNSSFWGAGNSGTVQIPKTFAILGPIMNYTFPGFYIPVPPGQTVQLVSVIGVLSAGTISVQCTRNGTGIPGLGSVSVTTGGTGYVSPTSSNLQMADQDYITIVTTSTSGTGDLTFDFVFDVTP
jgi:hypothetical protein